MRKPSIQVGDVFRTNNYGDCTVIEYRDRKNVVVRFSTGYIATTCVSSLKRGQVMDVLYPSVASVGYNGDGNYNSVNRTTTNNIWRGMLQRCYNKNHKQYNTYGGRGVTVCVEWHNFQSYCLWYEENHQEGFQLDKDLKIQGNKIYSPSTCVFIPRSLNSLLAGKPKQSGLPLGARKSGDKYWTSVRLNSKAVYLGTFTTPMQAFQAYKVAKTAIIQDAATMHYAAGDIDEDVYNSLMQWEIQPYAE